MCVELATTVPHKRTTWLPARDRIGSIVSQPVRRHAELIQSCIERRGGDTSTTKDALAKMTAMVQGMSGIFVSDAVVKASLASYTFEHMEISSYKALIAAAEVVGDAETKRVCEQILEEEALAQWLADHLPSTVT